MEAVANKAATLFVSRRELENELAELRSTSSQLAVFQNIRQIYMHRQNP